jgi:MraZ protein
MFIGRYYHTLEKNGRLSLPKTFREQADDWILTRGMDGGLFLFRPEKFSSQVEELKERTFTKKRHRDFIRLMVNDAQKLTTDEVGRVLLPEYLIAQAQLKKEVVIVGSYDYVEIWDRDRYHTYLDQLSSQTETLAESLIQNE